MKQSIFGLLCILLLFTSFAFAADTWRSTVDLDGRHSDSQETNFGNFVADSIRNETTADIAVIQASAFQEDVLLKAGVIDEQMIRGSLTTPISKLSILTMKPAVLKKIMERAVSKSVVKPFLQVSGMKVVYDSSIASNNRIVSISINNKQLDFNDDKTTLTVAMPRELGQGASGYSMVYPKEVIASIKVTEKTVIDSIRDEFDRNKGTISPTVDGRITDVNSERDEKKD